jgi:T-complex protein 1 subunit alpha
MSVQELFIDGERLVGAGAREKNLSSILSVANAVASSYGPHGLDKMLVSKIGDVSITNDGATILGSMETADSASRILVDLAIQQDREAGDGTTSVVLLAAALIENGIKLIEGGVHPTTVVSGYKIAFRQAMKFVGDKLEKKLKVIGQQELTRIVESTISSKVIRNNAPTFSKILVSAIQAIKRVDHNKHAKHDIKEVNILKKQGKSMDESVFVNGYAVNCLAASKLMPTKVAKAKIVCLDMDLQGTKMGLGVKISVDDPEALEEIRQREKKHSADRVTKLVKAGASVIFTTKGINDVCAKILIEAKAMGIRRCKREELVGIARATGTQVYTSLEDIDGTDFVPAFGYADSVYIASFGEDECTIIQGARQNGASIILRGPNEQVLDEMERSVHDGLCSLKRTLECKSVVVGGGAFEAAISVYLKELSLSFGTNEQIVIQKFAEALLKIPKTLLINAALDSNDILSQLVGAQENSQDQMDFGLDLEKGEVRNNFKAGVIEPAESKKKALRAATEAAISILRIDEIIVLNDNRKANK